MLLTERLVLASSTPVQVGGTGVLFYSQSGNREVRNVRFANCRPNVRVMIKSAIELGMLRVAEHDAQTAHGG